MREKMNSKFKIKKQFYLKFPMLCKMVEKITFA